MDTHPDPSPKAEEALAIASLACGIAAWGMFSIFPLVPGLIAVLLGGRALRRPIRRFKRRWILGWLGLALGALSLLTYLGMVVRLGIAFWRNPVAH